MIRNGCLIYSDDQEWTVDQSEVIGNGKRLLDEKGLEEKVLEGIAMATGERDTITTGEGCYGDGRWLLWGWEMVAMVT